jgi:ribose 5-phosphate isomerase B
MRVYLGSDHAGFELKAHLLAELAAAGHETVDIGPQAYDPDDDYPAYCIATATAVVGDPGSLGVVIGSSGNGEQIAANKVAGVRAALAWNEETARLSREHNDANVVGIGARMHTPQQAADLVSVFVSTPFSHGERHQRRIDQVTAYEQARELPPVG